MASLLFPEQWPQLILVLLLFLVLPRGHVGSIDPPQVQLSGHPVPTATSCLFLAGSYGRVAAVSLKPGLPGLPTFSSM